ncbi:MAG: glycosyltransferase family 2 protein [Candidatus Competibacterales bacterium]
MNSVFPVSVIIPTHNRASLLPRCLDSVLNQNHPPEEVIVVDDGSTDDTPEQLRRYGKAVRVLRQPRGGVSRARNRGIAAARHPWLAFLDSDDVWLPGKLQRQGGEVASRARVIHGEEIWIRRGRRVNPMAKHAKAAGWCYLQCLPRCAISPSAVVIHRDVFARIGPFDEALPACEDYDLWLRLTSHFFVALVPEAVVVKYGGHADQLSRRFDAMDRFRVYALAKRLRQGGLTPAQRRATAHTLEAKLAILIQGAEKRGRKASHYRQQRLWARRQGVLL